VRRLTTDKPEGYAFKPGQAALVAVDKDGMHEITDVDKRE